MKWHFKPVNLLVFDLLVVPYEDPRHGRDELPSRGVLALEFSPYVAHQGFPGPLRVEVGVQLGYLTGSPQPLSGHEAAVIREYGQQALPLRARPCGLSSPCLLEPGQQQAQTPVQPGDRVQLVLAVLDSPPEGPAALQPHRVHADLTDLTSGNRVKHDSCDPDKPPEIQ